MEDAFFKLEDNIYEIGSAQSVFVGLFPLVSGFSVQRLYSHDFTSFLIFRLNANEYTRVLLNGLIDLTFGSRFCLRCGQPLPLDYSETYCNSCFSESELCYRDCLYHSPFISFSQSCSPSSPACSFTDNLFRCFSPFYLYFGRFGNIIKVGISRYYSSSALRFRRILEQGLNEAIIIYPFKSLPDVTFYERLLIDEFGLNEKITFSDKVNDLFEPCLTKIVDYYSLSQIKELFPSKKLLHLEFYRDNPLNSILTSNIDVVVKRDLNTLRGNIIFTQGNIGAVKQCNTITFFDIKRLVGRTVRRSNEWSF